MAWSTLYSTTLSPALICSPGAGTNPFGLFAPQAPGDGVAQKSLIHRVLQGLARVAVCKVAQAPLAWLIGPSGRRHRAVVRSIFEQQMDLIFVIGWRVLLVGDGKISHAASDR